ncbi:hypothetical protein ACHQM5_026827 [Ranunculus cassubicifolius]
MECNKDDAIKAKELADKKMQNKDFVGARLSALKAEKLYPGLENITKMVTVCDVHISFERKLFGSETDWYGVLQVDRTADEASMKKQYRKLALQLHPDKNKFEGAESAFKLVGEAHRFLLDPVKRAQYDMRYKDSLRTTVSRPPQQQTKNPSVRKQPGVDNDRVDIARHQFAKRNLQQQQQQQKQQSQPGGPSVMATFWTACPTCSVRYQYYVDVLNRSLRCPKCSHPFVATDVSAQAAQPGTNWSQFGFTVQNGVPVLQKNVQKNPSGTGPGGGIPAPEPFAKAAHTSEVPPESQHAKQESKENSNGKKGKKRSTCEDESSDSLGRKSVKQNDFASPLMNSGRSRTPNVTVKQNGVKNSGSQNGEANGHFSSNGSSSKKKPDPEFFDVPDPDFHDFDQDRKEERFASDQLWAVYDTTDGMPRFYARIRKFWSPGFKVRITWLEADPSTQEEIDWVNEDLPTACGKFKFGSTETTEDINMFSHLVVEKNTGRSCYSRVYPKVGEIWALFKNWDIKWSADPENHRNYEFEFVEVLSDFAERSSVEVAYLGKVKGFVSLFGLRKGMASLQIPSNQLFRFSHKIPSYKTTGAERDGIGKGYFELDPAALPEKIEEILDPEDVEVDRKPTENTTNKPSTVTATQNDVEPLSPSSMDPIEIPDPEFYDFEAHKTPEKFQPGQVWALYCELDAMPKYYARINRVIQQPAVQLHITWLEADRSPKDMIKWSTKEMPVSCGTFRHQGTAVLSDTNQFSHLSEAKVCGRNKYEIIPRKGEVWALYKNFNCGWTCSDLQKCKYDIAVVVDIDIRVTKVKLLELVDGFDTVFKACENVVSEEEIPQVETLRFSHKVPAFQLTEERDGSLKGFWELDPKSMPYCLFQTT